MTTTSTSTMKSSEEEKDDCTNNNSAGVGTTTTTTTTTTKKDAKDTKKKMKIDKEKVVLKTSSNSRNGGQQVRDCDSKRIDGIQVYVAKLAFQTPTSAASTTSATSTSATNQKKQPLSSFFLFFGGNKNKKNPSSSSSSIRLYTLLFVLLYMYQIRKVWISCGEPYREFLQKADVDGVQIMMGSTRHKAELQHAYKDLDDINRRTAPLNWKSWIDMDIEELAIEKKRDKEKNVLDSIPKHLRVPGKYQTGFWPTLLLGVLGTIHALLLLLQHWSVKFHIFMNYHEINVDMAYEYMINHNLLSMDPLDLIHSSTSTSTSTGSTSSTNDANNTINTSASTNGGTTAPSPTTNANNNNKKGKYELDSSGNPIIFPDREITTLPNYKNLLPSHARIIPSKSSEKDVLVPVLYYPTLGMCIEYHRRRYVYNVDERMWIKIRCRTDFHLNLLTSWKGFPSSDQTIAAQIRFGPNMFKVKRPTFTELYKAQILNPFSVFQIFCVLLWAIDDYIVYSLFSLFMVLMFEGTVVFQRLKSLQALQGMGNPSRIVAVYRGNVWQYIDSTELLPGDIVSLVLVKPHRHKNKSSTGGTAAADDDKKTTTTTKKTTVLSKIEDEGGDVVPADLLVLRGKTVVSEASLTGESVPQMKEGVSELCDEHSQPYTLSMKARHKMNVVFAGTKMLQCEGGTTPTDGVPNNNNNNSDGETGGSTSSGGLFHQIPNPPDNGCVCFVLRTGFASAQGKLVRMIEGSQEKVKGHEYETGLLLGLLCIFAILSSSYVLYHGMQNANRSKYELLLHCILIVTSVIRPELPMQMALAVNNSLMTLMKLHVFCTEPYRVPVAGKLNACLFDKTGTLTTDELVTVGVCEPNKLSLQSTATKTTNNNNDDGKTKSGTTKESDGNTDKLFTPMSKLSNSEAALVLAGCHSLVVYEDETTGDPLESAALRAMKWHVSTTTGHAEPMSPRSSSSNDNANATAAGSGGGKAITLNAHQPIDAVSIITRHHFSSKLQRMSCVVQAAGKKFAVAKGSPEAVGNLLATKPDGYDETAELLSKQGYRVIGLAYKVLETDVDKAIESRAACESNLTFAGFIAFTCMVRKDTAEVLKRLKEGGMSVAMITGDALLTAIHVAKEVNIVSEPLNFKAEEEQAKDKLDPELEKNEELRKLIEEKRGRPIHTNTDKSSKNKVKDIAVKPIAYLDTQDGSLYWRSYTDGSKVEDFAAHDIPRLSGVCDLATTGKCLAQALEEDPHMSKVLGYIKVFARMTPDAKETVIESLHSVGALCLMCGDGANDVGALKQADVGVALLSGFGNINAAKTDGDDDNEESKKKRNEKKDSDPAAVTAIMSREHLEQMRALPVSIIKMRIRQLGTDPNKYPEIVEKEDLVKLYQIKAREFAVKRHEQQNSLTKQKMTKQEQAAEKQRLMAEKQRKMQERIVELESQGVSFAAFKAMREFATSEMEEVKKKKGEMARAGGIEGSAAALAAQLEADGDMASADTPMIKLGDASIAAPFTSKMPSIRSCVDIVRQGRCTLVSSMQMYQIMALQCLISSYSLSVLYLDGVKYGDTQMTAMGLLGTVSFMSVSRSKPLDKLSRVQPLSSIFHPASFFSLLGQFAIHLATMVLAVQSAKKHLPPDWEIDLDGQFKPGILNTVVFLVSSVQQVTVFFVNLQGRPFMTGVTENRPLLWSLVATFILTFMFASETVPGLNRYFQLVPFPDEGFRDFILTILVMDLVATFMLDRFMKFLFAREILKASIEGTTMKDVLSLAKTFGVFGFLMYIFLGNSDQWDELLRMEETAYNTSLLAAGEVPIVPLADNISSTGECVNGVCEAIAEVVKEAVATTVKTVAQYPDDEF